MNLQRSVNNLIKELNKFDYTLEYVDRIWDIIFPDKEQKWHHIKVIKHYDVLYITFIDGDLCALEITAEKKVQLVPSLDSTSYPSRNDPIQTWNDLIISVNKWLQIVKKDWVKANRQVYEAYPINRRYGTVPNYLIRSLVPDIYRIDKELGKAKLKKFISILESGYFHDDKKTTRESMTVNDFFDYCKIAYLAGQRKDDYIEKKLTGREMYERYADGRHEGLLEIKADSKQEFSDWIDGQHPKKTLGGHPWEIKRGGNTTHIDLYVSRPSHSQKEKFMVTLSGSSIGRLKETICMFLGVTDTGLPISITDPEGICKRLLAQDNVGIIPCFDSLHRANQRFYEHQNVYDVLHYDDLGANKRRITPFITWERLPILKPSAVF